MRKFKQEALRGSHQTAFTHNIPAARVYHIMRRVSRTMPYMGISNCGKLAFRAMIEVDHPVVQAKLCKRCKKGPIDRVKNERLWP